MTFCQIKCDINNNLTSIVFPGNVTSTYEYDALNRLTVKIEQGVETRLAYNANNQVISQTNGQAVKTVFSYDSLGRLAQKTQGLLTPEQSTSSFGYDSNSNMVFITNGLNKTIFYQYNALNQRVLETKAHAVDTTTLDPDNIDYSGYTRSKAVAYDEDANPEIITKADNTTITYIYDSMDRVTQVRHNNV
ncbi:MAG: hypothetical protein ABIJ59_13920 [Pseudomonadota bacterium]